MKTLTLYEVGIDTLPKDGAEILVFTKHSSFGMFEGHSSNEGKVCYMYGDIADSLDEALSLGGYISTSEDDTAWEEGSMAITIDVASYSLVDGVLWMYCHEYYDKVAGMFPFQDKEYWDVAIEEGWLIVEQCIQDTYWDTPHGEQIKFDKWIVRFRESRYDVTWCVRKSGEKEFHNFHEWSEV